MRSFHYREPRSERSIRRVVARAVTAAAAPLLLAVSPALAAPAHSHALTATFGGATSTVVDPYPLSHPADVAIDESLGPERGDIYVADSGNHRIEKFTPTGEFILMFGQEVDTTTQSNVCTAASHDVCQPGVESSSPGGLVTPAYLAIDSSEGGGGDIYVADNGDGLVSKFDATGHLVSGWGVSGQKNGSDIIGNTSSIFERFDGLAVGPSGKLYVAAQPAYGLVFTYTRSGAFVSPNELGYLGAGAESSALKLGNEELYGYNGANQPHAIIRRPAAGNDEAEETKQVTVGGIPSTGFALDPSDLEIYQDTGTAIAHFSPACEPTEGLCEPIDYFGESELTGAKGVAVFGSATNSRTVYVADSEANDVAVFSDIRPTSVATAPTEVTETALTFTGHIDLAPNQPEGHPEIVECRFEYGFKKSYGTSIPCEPDPETNPFTNSTTEVSARISGLTPIIDLPVGTRYHYRVVASSAEGGTGISGDRTAQTTAPAQIEGVSASHVTATSAQLEATVASNGLPTRYHFEYGTTSAYGETTPELEISGSTIQLFESHTVSAAIENLQRGVTYHFRLIAENELDEGHPAVSEDHTFEFFPPTCPNSAVRQQTGSAYLPDCRAYELVSPANANGTLLYPGGPTSPTATSPSRLAYTGAFSALPEASETIGTNGDLYVATRQNSGWVSHYIGLAGDSTGCMGGPPTNPESHTTHAEKIQDWVLTDASLSRFLNFDLGTGANCYLSGNGTGDASQKLDLASNAPYLWNAEGEQLAHLPTNLDSSPGAKAALACPDQEGIGNYQNCTGEVSASGDLSRLFFSSGALSFAEAGEPAGLTVAPGSAYEDNLSTGKISVISRLPGGEDIPQDPAYAEALENYNSFQYPGSKLPEQFIRFPAVSTDGSHVLMSTATAVTEFCRRANSKVVCPRFTDTPVHLYMRFGGSSGVTKEISLSELTGENVAVTYVGAIPDLSKVFFTSDEHLTAEDPSHGGASLYVWSEKGEEEGHPLTLISKATPGSPPGAGDTASCSPSSTEKYNDTGQPIGESPWTQECSVVPYSGWSYANADGSVGGNGHSDSGIASANGDIYFYSPEQLDGNRGVPDQQNLYVYREGAVHFIATFPPTRFCEGGGFNEGACTDGPIARLEVTPRDTHMAFVTAARLTSYDNAGHLEMYSYAPSTGTVVCDSCNPNGKPATADVLASQNGLFLTEDGRTFFSTTESLLPADTNNGEDVYEFVDGAPKLITPGTGTATVTGTTTVSIEEQPGLIGVSADGTDVYFTTYDVLLSEDHNGNFLKFYDARTNGGFPQPPPAQPCAAAEECHGPGTAAPQLAPQGTAAVLTGGNSPTRRHAKHHKPHRPRGKRGRKRTAHHGRGGAK